MQLTGCEVEGNSRPSLRASLAGHFEGFHSFTLSSLFGVSVEHVALAFITHKAFPSLSLKPLVAFQARVWRQKLKRGGRKNAPTHLTVSVRKAQAANSSASDAEGIQTFPLPGGDMRNFFFERKGGGASAGI